jgi:hypothetical protein
MTIQWRFHNSLPLDITLSVEELFYLVYEHCRNYIASNDVIHD